MAGWDDRDSARPRTPGWVTLFVIGLLVVGGWIALSVVFAIAGRVIALLGYVVVAVIAYFIGKAVGRASAHD